MAIVGPRPEAPDIVARYYSADDMRSLEVAPGLTSPGSIFYYTHGEQLLADGEAEQFYVSRLLPLKMKLDLAYLERANAGGDMRVVLTTALVLLQKAVGRKSFPLPAEVSRLFLREHMSAESSTRLPFISPAQRAA